MLWQGYLDGDIEELVDVGTEFLEDEKHTSTRKFQGQALQVDNYRPEGTGMPVLVDGRWWMMDSGQWTALHEAETIAW